MELAIRPEELRAAAVALAACASRLDDAAARFNRAAHDNVGHLGFKAITRAGQAAILTDHAVETLHRDIAALGHALTALAEHYPRVDASAVIRR